MAKKLKDRRQKQTLEEIFRKVMSDFIKGILKLYGRRLTEMGAAPSP